MTYQCTRLCENKNEFGFCKTPYCINPFTIGQNQETRIIFSKKITAKTNADKIRAMTDEELAHLLHSAEVHLFSGNMMNHTEWLDWLEQEASDETD